VVQKRLDNGCLFVHTALDSTCGPTLPVVVRVLSGEEMPKLIIKVSEKKVTVSQMRRQFAQILSKLQGDSVVDFMFLAVIEDYKPNVKS
jgi:predicted aldo/keto reductase-like oxidoreductase